MNLHVTLKEMNSRTAALLTALLVGTSLLAAQSGVSIVGAGYVDPSAIILAPGQITTLFLRDVKSTLPTYQAASGFPLPTTLAGLSVTLRQFTNVDPIPVPILSIRKITTGCFGALPGSITTEPCRVIALTIQVPTGLSFPKPASPPDPNRRQELVVFENGVPGPAFAYILFTDNIHVLSDCDPIRPSAFASCSNRVTHADGTLVQGSKPAEPGEILVLYAVGLGGTDPIVPAGSPAPLPPAVRPFPLAIAFDFTPSATPAWPGPASATVVRDQAVFAGLTPNYAGLYQVNFKVPTPPAGTPACLSSPNVQSNVTVTLVGDYTFDGAQFCVKVPAPAP